MINQKEIKEELTLKIANTGIWSDLEATLCIYKDGSAMVKYPAQEWQGSTCTLNYIVSEITGDIVEEVRQAFIDNTIILESRNCATIYDAIQGRI